MSDKISAFIIVLEGDISEEWANKMKDALMFFKGVVGVEKYVAGSEISGEITASIRADKKWRDAVFELLKS